MTGSPTKLSAACLGVLASSNRSGRTPGMPNSCLITIVAACQLPDFYRLIGGTHVGHALSSFVQRQSRDHQCSTSKTCRQGCCEGLGLGGQVPAYHGR